MTDEPDLAEHAPAHDLNAERATLGAMMLNPAIADQVSEILTGLDFYQPKNATIFRAILRLVGRGEPADAVAVNEALAESGDLSGVGGAPYLSECLNACPVAMNGPYYARRVVERAQRRRIVEAGEQLLMLGRGPGEIADVIEKAQKATHEATTDRRRDTDLVVSVGDLVAGAIQHVEDVAAGKIPTGIPTGWSDYDRLTGGHRPGQLIIPAGRTAMGKSVWTQNVVRNCASAVIRPTILFSVEMSTHDMMLRLLAQEARVPLHALQSGQIRDEDRVRLRDAEERMLTWPLYVVDSCRTIPAIRSYVRRFVQKYGDLAMFAVDYLQRVTPTDARADRHLVVGQFADDLKTLAQETDSVCIAPCQLNRGPEARTGKDSNRPKLSDLRESGNLEQTADIVVLLFRPAYYDHASPRSGEADFIVAKHRNGPTDTITVAEQLHLMRFTDMAIAPSPGAWE